MKIVDMKVFVLGCSWRNLVVVKLYTDEGVTGLGECTIQNREEGVRGYLEGAKHRHVLGTDPFNTEDLCMRMYRNDFFRGGVIACSAMSAVETACWDIVGKVLGQPVYRLLGGKCHEKVKAYANGWYTVQREPQAFAERAKVVVAKGYKALKVDPFGGGTYELDRHEKIRSIELVEAIRAAVGPDVEIFIEGHGRFSVATAVAIGRELERFDPGWFEEPVPPEDTASMRKVMDKVNIPIATGERLYTHHGFRELFEMRAADIIQPDVLHTGGLMEMKKIAAGADAHYIVVAPHNSNGPICTAASVHFAFCTTNFKIQECFDDFADPWVLEAVSGYPKVVDGYFLPPDKPGLGVEIHEEVFAEHPYKPGHFNLWDPNWQRRQYAGGD
jgi:galactonate dehydratase